MARIHLPALDEFVTSLSKLDYEAAKIASGKVMESHIQMGAIMFSLLTMEMMYTSMDYLTPENFRRGNSYLLNMYTPQIPRLKKLMKKLNSEYEEECKRLLSSRVRPVTTSTPSAASSSGAVLAKTDGKSDGYFGAVIDSGFGISMAPKHTARSTVAGSFASRYALHGVEQSNRSILGVVPSSYVDSRTGGTNTSTPSRQSHNHSHSNSHNNGQNQGQIQNQGQGQGQIQIASLVGPSRRPSGEGESVHRAGSAFEPFDPNQYLNNTKEAEAVMEELETLKKFVAFIIKFIEVRKTMVVLYCFIAVTGPVLYTKKLRLILGHCNETLKSIVSSPLYDSLLEHIRHEVRLVGNLVDWDAHVVAYNFVKAVTAMKNSRKLLKSWQAGLPESPASAIGAESRSAQDKKSRLGGSEDSGGHGLWYTAFAKSTRLVQNLIWGDSTANTSSESQSSAAGRMRGIVIWIGSWVEHLGFKTTVYFQQLIAPYRALQHDEPFSAALQQAVLRDVWSRQGISKINLGEMVTNFMRTYDGCFVALLFESSAHRPHTIDGFAISGTKVKVPDYHVQACATLFCVSNQKLLQSRGRIVKDSLVQDVHSINHNAFYRNPDNTRRQTDTEWFRQNCLPDILYILDREGPVLDFELLGSSPLLNQLGPEADALLLELGDTVCETLDIAAESMAEAEELARIALSEKQRAAEASLLAESQSVTRAQSRQGQLSARSNAPAAVDQGSMLHLPRSDPNYPMDLAASSGNSMGQNGGKDRHSAPLVPTELFQQASATSNPTPPSLHGLAMGGPVQATEENLSLYSTYLLKSHLRNNISTHENLARGAHSSETFATGHQQSQGPSRKASITYDAGNQLSSIRGMPEDIIEGAVGHSGGTEVPGRDMMLIKLARARKTGSEGVRGAAATPASTSASAAATDRHHPPNIRSIARRPATAYVSNENAAGKSIDIKPRSDSNHWEAIGSDTNDTRRLSTGNIHGIKTQRTSSAQEFSLIAGRRTRGVTTSQSNANLQAAKRSSSIRSLFRSQSKPTPAQSNQQSNSTPKTPESEVARRVHRGERLKELFGSWQTAGIDDEHEEASEAAGISEAEPRRGSLTSLSFSTPTRASLGRRAGNLALAAATTHTSMPSTSASASAAVSAVHAAVPSTESISGGLAHRLTRVNGMSRVAAANSAPGAAAMTPTAASLSVDAAGAGAGAGAGHSGHVGDLGSAAMSGLEHIFGHNILQRPRSARGAHQPQHGAQQQHQQQQHLGHHHQPSAVSSNSQAVSAESGGSEGYTYLYSRVGVPSVVLVAVVLDTEKGLSRRREATRAWDEIVGAVRGMPLFEQIMSLNS
ncbi:hypothetical protein GGI07_002516 [Coemansia sp. Benny D115]|nr:hypothetical protein GGI07_002516 [Coemansia sp. Benny D115]